MPIKEKKNTNNKSSLQQSENSSIVNSININNITSHQINNINLNDKKIMNQKGFFPLTAPISKQNSKANSKQKNGCHEKIKKTKIEKLNLNKLNKNYTSTNSPSHYIINSNNNMKINTEYNKDNSIIHNYLFPKNQKLKEFILKKNHNTNINKLLNDFKNEIGLNKLKQDKQKQKNKKDSNISSNNNKTENNQKSNQEKKSKSKSSEKKHKRNKKNINSNSLLNISNTSLLSTMKDSTYYMKESEILSKFIKEYYNKNKEYPKTDLSFYKYGRMIGKGAFGKVNLGLNILTGRVVAIKSFNKDNIKNELSKKKILYETNLMRKLRHPSITKILETFESEKYIFIIMEYISGGNLQSFVKKRRKLSEKTAKIFFKQIIEGIKYIHSQNIVHRDIKLENILIDLNNNIKICDFGVGKLINSNLILHDHCGTPVYMAPEIIKGEGYFGFPVDICQVELLFILC